MRGQAVNGARPPPDQPLGPGPRAVAGQAGSLVGRQASAEPRAFSPLRCPGYAYAQHGAFGDALAAVGIRQEPVGTVHCHEHAAERHCARRHTPRRRSPTPSGAPGRQIV